MAGFMIESWRAGKVQQFHWNDVEDFPAMAVRRCWTSVRKANIGVGT